MTMLKNHIPLQFSNKERFCFFLPTNLNSEQMHCRSGTHNSIEIASKNYKDFKELGLTVIENVIDEN